MSEYTKGEWEVKSIDLGCEIWIACNQNCIAKMECTKKWMSEEKANAHLMAAAPIGYEIATAILDQETDGFDRRDYILKKAKEFMAKAAIAKAKP